MAKKFIAAYGQGVDLVRSKPDEARQYLKGYTAIEGPLTGRGAAGGVHAVQRVHAGRRRATSRSSSTCSRKRASSRRGLMVDSMLYKG